MAKRSKNCLPEIMVFKDYSIITLSNATKIPKTTLRRIIFDGQEPTLRQAWKLSRVLHINILDIWEDLYYDCLSEIL